MQKLGSIKEKDFCKVANEKGKVRKEKGSAIQGWGTPSYSLSGERKEKLEGPYLERQSSGERIMAKTQTPREYEVRGRPRG